MHASQIKKDDDVTEEIQTFYSASDVKVAILSKKKKLKILASMMAYFLLHWFVEISACITGVLEFS